MPITRKINIMEKKFLQLMDRFFTFLLLISGEEDYETVSIGHIL